MQDYYIDGIGQVSIQGLTVRMELTALKTLTVDGEADTVQQEVSGRLAMSLNTLLALQKTTEHVVERLIEKGVLKRRDGELQSAGQQPQTDNVSPANR